VRDAGRPGQLRRGRPASGRGGFHGLNVEVSAQPADRSPGHAELVGVEEGTAYLRLSGGCQGCSMATVTLGQGIEVAIKELVPEITKVLDVTDHASGTNPYFEAAKK